MAYRKEGRWRSAFWPVPLILLAIAFALPNYTIELDSQIVATDDQELLQFLPGSLEGSRSLASTIAAAMLSFIAVVFSISVVALQMASGQLSPRILRMFVRQRLTKWTLGVFLATFTFALSVLGYLDDPQKGEPAFLPITSMAMVWVLVTTSLVLFVAYVSRLLKLMQPVVLIDETTGEARAAVDVLYKDIGPDLEEPMFEGPHSVVCSSRNGILTFLDTARMTRLARHLGCRIRVVPRMGEYVVRGAPLVEVYGLGTRPPVRRILWCFGFGDQRTIPVDPAYGLRLLVDIAIRALSAAINDPTTTVQALDRIFVLLQDIGVRRELTGVYADRHGEPRVHLALPTWDRLVELAFTEIRHYGGKEPQVSRRLFAGLDELIRDLPRDRAAALQTQRGLLAAAVVGNAPNSDEQRIALHPDAQGLG